jgi:protoheme IX farnesyltransferase
MTRIAFKSTCQAYLELCKPRVVALMLLTALVGMFLASSSLPDWQPVVFGTLGIACMAGAAAAFNHLLDHPIDKMMRRTQYRPLPTCRISPRNAWCFALILAAVGLLVLMVLVNPLTAFLTLLTLFGYAVVYTLYLKHATPQNIVIGGIAGAAPPLLGWTAMTNHIDPNSLLLVLIIFIWTPPHFWALAIHRHQDYSRAAIPMLPVTHGIPFTKWCILLYTVLLVAVSTLPFVTHMSGLLYLTGALALGGGFLYYAISLQYKQNPVLPLKTFRYSIIYLFGLFVILLVDHYIMVSL